MTSKILMTGFTPMQVGSKHRSNVSFTNTDAVYKALCDLGYDVTWDKPTIRTDPKDYDFIVVGLYAISSLVSRYGYKSAYLAYRAREAGVPIMTFIDDWHLPPIESAFRRFTSREPLYTRGAGGIRGRHTDEERDFFMANMRETIEGFCLLWKADYPVVGLVMSVFPWVKEPQLRGFADALGVDFDRISWVDPIRVIPQIGRNEIPISERVRGWILGTRYPDPGIWAAKLDTGDWPVILYGCKKAGWPTVPTEVDLIRVYERHTGVMSYPYPKRLIGLWRNRYQFATEAGCVSYGPPDEVRGIVEDDDSNPFLIEPKDVAGMPPTQLENLATAQKWAFDDAVRPREEYLSEFRRLIEGVL